MNEVKILRDEFLCRGRRVALYRRIIGFKENVFEKDLVDFGNAVVILPLLTDGNAVFVKQWRAAVNNWVLELPAGRIDNGEEPYDAAIRELEEETGYRAKNLELLAKVYVTPGYSNEQQWIFIARNLEFVGAKPERGEILSTVLMKPYEYIDIALKGEHVDLKSLSAILLFLYKTHRG